MTRHKTADVNRFAKMVGGNMRFLRLSHTPFKPQKVLAYHLGLTFQQVQKYESGKNIPCSYRLTQIADFYKVTPNDLVDPSFIHRSTKNNEILDRAKQDLDNLLEGGISTVNIQNYGDVPFTKNTSSLSVKLFHQVALPPDFINVGKTVVKLFTFSSAQVS